MKYAIIFAATAAAHQAYGGYGADAHSSVQPSSTAAPTDHSKQPSTMTTQGQAHPTCVSAAYGDKSCAKWGEDAYVSTVIKDYDNNYATITNTDQPVIVYHTKTTITHSATGTGSAYAAPTGTASKDGTAGCWYELYEKIEEVPYKNLGPKALPGYAGSGLYTKGDKEQPVHVKEYKGGKWSEYEHVYFYGEPKPEVKVYEKPGVYVVPSKDMVVDRPVDRPAEATTTAKAGETCTYGGQSVTATQTGYITAPYAGYKTKVEGGKTTTETVIQYTTLYASTTGTYEVAKPTTTVYDHDTELTFPTAQHYEAGVYHQPAQTVTITSAGQAYTCEYEKTKATPSPMLPGHGNAYGGNHAGSSPAHSSSSVAHPSASTPAAAYPSSPAAAPSKPAHYGGNHYGAHSASTMSTVPVQAASTPAGHYGSGSSSTPSASSTVPAGYPAPSSPAAYGSHPAASSPAAYGSHPAASSPAASQPAPAASSPAAYGSHPAAYGSHPAASQPAPAASSPAAYGSHPAASQPAPAASSPAAYGSHPAASSPAAYGSQPAASSPAASQPAPAASSPAAYGSHPAASSPAAYQPVPAVSSPAAYQPAAPSTPATSDKTPSTNEYASGSAAYGSGSGSSSSEQQSDSYANQATY